MREMIITMYLLRCLLPLAVLLVPTGAQLLRKDVDSLSDLELLNLRRALRDVAQDTSSKGYAAIAAYHGYPAQCTENGQEVACCRHGSPVFPQWHKLYVVQMEQALKEKGLTQGVPYWDWTKSITQIPELFREQNYTEDGDVQMNPWHRGNIIMGTVVKETSRGLDERLFENELTKDKHTKLFEQVLNALEYPNYCQFEVQFEIAHNAIHYLVGGKNPYSMSLLEFAAYDPIFFSYHSNVDRVYAVYEALYGAEGHPPGYECKQNCEVCDVKGFQENLEPFNRDSNPFPITRTHSTALLASNRTVFGYEFDSLTLGGQTVDKIKQLLTERRSKDRAFANFRLHGIKMSANIKVMVCSPSTVLRNGRSCEFAGEFFVLGGSTEMSWAFTRPYFHEITDTVLKMGLRLTDNYHVYAEVYNIFGVRISDDILPAPSVEYRPGVEKPDAPMPSKQDNEYKEVHGVVTFRKDVDSLTDEEVDRLRKAMETVHQKARPNSFQDIAEMHGDPAKCPNPNSKELYSCCVHGMPNFPHWHRLYVIQLEDALRINGERIGVPYWDWTKPGSRIPEVARNKTYYDPRTNTERNNPFFDAEIQFLNMSVRTSRDVLNGLSQFPTWTENTELMDTILLALEQDNFCDFEIQFEVAHNLIHGLVGGNSTYSMSTLAYSAFDPIFFLHHSFVDKIWSVWTSLQQLRGKPYKAHCAQSYIYEPLKPFAFSSPYNPNERTSAASVPTNIYDHEVNLGYTYDTLDFGGMSLQELENYINTDLKGKPRVFVGILLLGIRKSAVARIYITKPGSEKKRAGQLMLLGGPAEMPWRFDRLYRLDITKAMNELNLQWDDTYDVTMEMTEFDGTPVDAGQFPKLEIIYKAPEETKIKTTDKRVRKDVSQLTDREVDQIRRAMAKLQATQNISGFQELANIHSAPRWCPSLEDPIKQSCGPHGLPEFLHWLRLYTVQAENALRRQGYVGGLPYWDWTRPMKSLPKLVEEPTYNDPSSGAITNNPFFGSNIGAYDTTERSVQEKLFVQPPFGEFTEISQQILLALEQKDFCSFKVQLEITQNKIHQLVGGSMASLTYTAFDPLFLLHAANTDRIWAIWQALQVFRGKPHATVTCQNVPLYKPLLPFSLPDDTNPDTETRQHSRPFEVNDYKSNFNFEYANLELDGLSVYEINEKVEINRQRDRVFAGLNLRNIKESAIVKLYICRSANDCNNYAGEFFILGDLNEMSWTHDRLYKFDITNTLSKLQIAQNDNYYVRYEVLSPSGKLISTEVFSDAVVIRSPVMKYSKPGKDDSLIATDEVIRKDVDELTEEEMNSLKNALLELKNENGSDSFEEIAGFHGAPFKCPATRENKYACCVHGMPIFPHWHRLLTVQFERGLKRHHSIVGVPYWDWTKSVTTLPKLFSEGDEENPFKSHYIKFAGQKTTRDVVGELFFPPKVNGLDKLLHLALTTLEEDNFCDFEIHYEVLHNEVHHLIGGKGTYSMATLDFSAFDPYFMILHSTIDRIWIMWQELQTRRQKPAFTARCAGETLNSPLEPFSYPGVNSNELTRVNADPNLVFYYSRFGYKFDKLELSGLSVDEVDEKIIRFRNKDRVYLGLLLSGQQTSLTLDVTIITDKGEYPAGQLHILGGEKEMPWAFERFYKHDVTDVIKRAEIQLGKPIRVKMSKVKYNGDKMDDVVEHATIIERPAGTSHEIVVIPVSANSNQIHPKIVVKMGTFIKFITDDVNVTMEDLGSFTALQKCQLPKAPQHSYEFGVAHSLPPGNYFITPNLPSLCNKGLKIHITVEDE